MPNFSPEKKKVIQGEVWQMVNIPSAPSMETEEVRALNAPLSPLYPKFSLPKPKSPDGQWVMALGSVPGDCDCDEWTDYPRYAYDYTWDCETTGEPIGTKISIDPTFTVTHKIYATPCSTRCWTTTADNLIGQGTIEGGTIGSIWQRAYLRYETNQFPWDSQVKIRAARLVFAAAETSTGTDVLNVGIKAMSSPYFSVDSLSNPTQWNDVPHWTSGNTYYSPDISCLLDYIFNRQHIFDYRENFNSGQTFSPPHDLILLIDPATMDFGWSGDQVRKYMPNPKLEIWYSRTFDEDDTLGGVELGGSASISIIRWPAVSGGIEMAGAAASTYIPTTSQIYNEVATGSVLMNGSNFNYQVTAHTHYIVVTVPAGKVQNDIYNFPLGIWLPDNDSQIVDVTDIEGNSLPHDIRWADGDHVVLFTTVNLIAAIDNVFLVYYGAIII